eukprot:Skav202825  [mRNA]  locus=scaffold3852:185537:191481:- [translate_table: standard]
MDQPLGNTAEPAVQQVTTDRLAIPFSKGRYLLSIYSKKYLDEGHAADAEPFIVHAGTEEEQEAKSERNKKKPGAKRLDGWLEETQRFAPAKFDQSSVGLFLLLAQKAARNNGPQTHFMPLAMWTHRLVPPPEDAKASVGESRSAQRAAVALNFGEAQLAAGWAAHGAWEEHRSSGDFFWLINWLTNVS